MIINSMIRVEFPIGGDIHLRMLAEETLAGELDRWCKQHNLDRSQYRTGQREGGVVYIAMPNIRSTELFAISWHSDVESLNHFRVRYG